jgi:hypothetical protein
VQLDSLQGGLQANHSLESHLWDSLAIKAHNNASEWLTTLLNVEKDLRIRLSGSRPNSVVASQHLTAHLAGNGRSLGRGNDNSKGSKCHEDGSEETAKHSEDDGRGVR